VGNVSSQLSAARTGRPRGRDGVALTPKVLELGPDLTSNDRAVTWASVHECSPRTDSFGGRRIARPDANVSIFSGLDYVDGNPLAVIRRRINEGEVLVFGHAGEE